MSDSKYPPLSVDHENVMGMQPQPPPYGAGTSPNPVNPSVQPQAFPCPPQTAIMPYMAEIPGVTQGLEYLTQIDQVLINEKFSSGQRWNRSYEVLNSLNQRIFVCTQEVECCGALYNMHIADNSSKEVIQLLQHCKCSCSPNLEIYCPPGNSIGYCIWNWSAFVTSLSIQNAARQCVLVVLGPGLQTNIFGDVNFEVKSNDETQTVGMIRRESGHFSVHFPLDLDVNMKAVLIGSSLFLDHAIYQQRMQMMRNARQNQHHHHHHQQQHHHHQHHQHHLRHARAHRLRK